MKPAAPRAPRPRPPRPVPPPGGHQPHRKAPDRGHHPGQLTHGITPTAARIWPGCRCSVSGPTGLSWRNATSGTTA